MFEMALEETCEQKTVFPDYLSGLAIGFDASNCLGKSQAATAV
jgi:hypothetical protein